MKKIFTVMTLLLFSLPTLSSESFYNNVPTFVKNSDLVALTSSEVRDDLAVECQSELQKEIKRIKIEFGTYNRTGFHPAIIIAGGSKCKIHTHGMGSSSPRVNYQVSIQFMKY